jgi:hypothetical protein
MTKNNDFFARARHCSLPLDESYFITPLTPLILRRGGVMRPFKVVPFTVPHEAKASHYRLGVLGEDSLWECAIGITSFTLLFE